MKAPSPLASIDIGSNSILLLVGRIEQGKLYMEFQRKETIRLGGALDAQGHLQPDAVARGLDCLRRYAGLIAHIPTSHRRAVATQTLREAANREAFLQQARAILGCEVTVISGEQEAQLIYQGVTSLLPPSEERRLVLDIGGRSTELCLGSALQLQAAASFATGSVAWAQRFFADGHLHAERFAAAEHEVHTLMAPSVRMVEQFPWDAAYGSSGTAGAISKVLHQRGEPAGQISRTGLLALKAALVQAGHIDRVPLQGLRDELRPVIGGGISIMCAVFALLGIERMRVTQGALRHGVLLALGQELETV